MDTPSNPMTRYGREDALLDRVLIVAPPEAYTRFLARMDAPPQPNERLHRALRTPPPWD